MIKNLVVIQPYHQFGYKTLITTIIAALMMMMCYSVLFSSFLFILPLSPKDLEVQKGLNLFCPLHVHE